MKKLLIICAVALASCAPKEPSEADKSQRKADSIKAVNDRKIDSINRKIIELGGTP